MTELFKEMRLLSGKLNDLIDKTKGKEKKQNLLELFFRVNKLCKKIAKRNLMRMMIFIVIRLQISWTPNG